MLIEPARIELLAQRHEIGHRFGVVQRLRQLLRRARLHDLVQYLAPARSRRRFQRHAQRALALRGFQRGPYIQGKYTYIRSLPRGGQLHIEFKNNKSGADETRLTFRADEKEVPASQLDPIDLADAIYDLQP